MSDLFRLETTGGREIERRMANLAERFGDLTPLMQIFGTVLEDDTLDRFDTETAPDGSAWAKSGRAKVEGGKTLTDSSQLRSSIHHVAGADQVEVGTNKIYGRIHNEGGTIRAKSAAGLRFKLPGKLGFRRVMEVELPQRQFLGLSPFAEQELLDQANDYALEALGGPSA